MTKESEMAEANEAKRIVPEWAQAPIIGLATTPAKAQPRPSDFFTGHSKYCHDGGITFAASSAA
jgi:hypothetical protein